MAPLGLMEKPGKSECGRVVKGLLELYWLADRLSEECGIIGAERTCAKLAEAVEEVMRELARAEELGCTGPTGRLRRELSERAERLRKRAARGW